MWVSKMTGPTSMISAVHPEGSAVVASLQQTGEEEHILLQLCSEGHSRKGHHSS